MNHEQTRQRPDIYMPKAKSLEESIRKMREDRAQRMLDAVEKHEAKQRAKRKATHWHIAAAIGIAFLGLATVVVTTQHSCPAPITTHKTQ